MSSQGKVCLSEERCGASKTPWKHGIPCEATLLSVLFNDPPRKRRLVAVVDKSLETSRQKVQHTIAETKDSGWPTSKRVPVTLEKPWQDMTMPHETPKEETMGIHESILVKEPPWSVLDCEAKPPGSVLDCEAKPPWSVLDWVEAKPPWSVLDCDAKPPGSVPDWVEAKPPGSMLDWVETEPPSCTDPKPMAIPAVPDPVARDTDPPPTESNTTPLGPTEPWGVPLLPPRLPSLALLPPSLMDLSLTSSPLPGKPLTLRDYIASVCHQPKLSWFARLLCTLCDKDTLQRLALTSKLPLTSIPNLIYESMEEAKGIDWNPVPHELTGRLVCADRVREWNIMRALPAPRSVLRQVLCAAAHVFGSSQDSHLFWWAADALRIYYARSRDWIVPYHVPLPLIYPWINFGTFLRLVITESVQDEPGVVMALDVRLARRVVVYKGCLSMLQDRLHREPYPINFLTERQQDVDWFFWQAYLQQINGNDVDRRSLGCDGVPRDTFYSLWFFATQWLTQLLHLSTRRWLMGHLIHCPFL